MTNTTDRPGLLTGKVLLVAGVGPQMGRATALVAAREGARVALLARSRERLAAVSKEIEAAGGSALALPCDLGEGEQVQGAVEQTVAAFGRLDAVFYNAAFYDDDHRSLEVDEATLQATMDVNLNGPLRLARLAVPHMLEQGGGAFVFNSTAASLRAENIRLGYSLSKAGLNALTRFVASRYGRQGIRANAILPFVAGGDVGKVAASLNCLGRSGTADEIAEAVVFLCSERASIITGQVIHLDGGLLIRAAWPAKTDAETPPPD